jgi:phospholipid transport system substrate-binding protein
MVLAVWLCWLLRLRHQLPLDDTRTILDQARTIIAGNQTQDGKLAALSVLLNKFLDSDEMGREALGHHWSSFTAEQQKEFLALFRNLLERTYAQTLLLFQNPDFVCAGQQFTGPARWSIPRSSPRAISSTSGTA